MDGRISYTRNTAYERGSSIVCHEQLVKWYEELSLIRYASLKKSGDLDRITAQDLSAVQGLNENEIRDAIEELKRSTAAIEKQTEALKLQQSAMSSLVKNGQRSSQARASSTDVQHQKWTTENGHITKAVWHEKLREKFQF